MYNVNVNVNDDDDDDDVEDDAIDSIWWYSAFCSISISIQFQH